MDEPNIRNGVPKAFCKYFLKVHALVVMSDQLGESGQTELKCGSHVSRILVKLPHHLRANFKRHVNPFKTPIPALVHPPEWLEYKVRAQEDGTQFSSGQDNECPGSHKEQYRVSKLKSTSIFHGSEQRETSMKPLVNPEVLEKAKETPKKFWWFLVYNWTPMHPLINMLCLMVA